MQNSIKKKYRTILADPPWDIQQKGTYGAVHHYDLMTLDRIK
ncbi:cytosine methyltransferase, partial [Candidatus Saccharibacteria bacterium]|nr:cytosine methyltransferase [Candidatus Saccharibacteria bacterium]